jgi:DNA-binding NtrC family response regulator
VSDGRRIDDVDLGGAAGMAAAPRIVRDADELEWPSPLGTLVRSACVAMVQRCAGNKSQAARRLGISRQRLQRLIDVAADGSPINDTHEED